MSLHEVSPADYHARLKCDRSNVLSPDSWLSKSVLWELAKSSLFAWRFHPKQFTPTSSMQWGSLVDCLTTTPDEVDDQVAISPFESFRTKEAKQWRDEQLNQGKILTNDEEFSQAKLAAEMLLVRNSVSAEIFARSSKQVIIGGMIAGAQVKGLLDLVPEDTDYLADLKTTNDFTLDGFAKTMATFGYHVQAGLYLALWNAMFAEKDEKGNYTGGGDYRDSFRIIWQSSAPPYEVVVTEVSQNDTEHGLNYATHLVERVVNATKANHWPMLMEGSIPVLNRPTWASIAEESKIESEQEQVIEAPAVEVEEVA